MANDSPLGIYDLLEEWDYDNIHTAAANGVKWLVSSDAGDTAFAVTTGLSGGQARASLAATDNNMCEIGRDIMIARAQDGFMEVEVRFKVDVVTTVAFNIGFNDDQLEDSNTLPIELSGTTFTANAATFVGFVFDVDATNDYVHVFWADGGVASTTPIATLKTDFVPTAGEFATYRVRLEDQGSGYKANVVFTIIDHNGKMYEERYSNVITRGTFLTPYVAVENRDAVAHVPDIDYIRERGSRA